MRRRLVAVVLGSVAMSVLASSAPASAGGWDSLRFRRDHYLVGQVATARTEFFAGELEGSGPLDGRTYHAYLLPSSRDTGFGMIQAPTIPDDAIRLGALEVRGPFTRDGGSYRYGIASLGFTVPDVPSGDYAIGFCDDPCTHGSVGWLAWGEIRIVHTPFEGRLLGELDRARQEMVARRWDLRQAERRSVERIGRLVDELRAARTALRVSAPAETPPAPAVAVAGPAPDGTPWWPGALAGAALGALGAWGLGRWTRRGRRPGPPRAPRTSEDAERDRVPARV